MLGYDLQLYYTITLMYKKYSTEILDYSATLSLACPTSDELLSWIFWSVNMLQDQQLWRGPGPVWSQR